MIFTTSLATSWPSLLSSLLSGFLILILALSTSAADRNNIKRRQAPDVLPIDPITDPGTECTNSVYSIGRYLQYHYICCDGIQSNPANPGGTGQTTCKEEPVANWDCNPSNAFGTLNETFFNCNGTEGQNNVKQKCDPRWRWLAEDTCWVWTSCFKGACEKEELELGSSADGFCGDGACGHGESQDECPIDCCPAANFECQVTNNTCPEVCCGEPACCLNKSYLISENLWLYVIGSIAGVVLLLNLICCCFCLCCYKGFKRCKRSSSSSSRVPMSNMKL